jgi:colicin import membrane protein|tara:strand:+ start:159 stop:692 length:534 start_codon:yes stop_codon:yes gene_type:complete
MYITFNSCENIVKNKSIKIFVLLLISFNVLSGGDESDDAYYANLDAELAAFEAQVAAELASQQLMAEIEAEMARKSALDAFLQKLADDKASAAASTAAYQASLKVEEAIEVVIEEVAINEVCKPASNLSESNVELFKSALADGSLFNVGPQSSNGTEFGANRWDAYANCVSNYVNPF